MVRPSTEQSLAGAPPHGQQGCWQAQQHQARRRRHQHTAHNRMQHRNACLTGGATALQATESERQPAPAAVVHLLMALMA